jgi:NAD(P)-dependent dehydrogenase (short-subunit alcohol dehydrogenase family)
VNSFPENYRALVIGSSGAIGSAFVDALRADSRCSVVASLSRRETPGFSLEEEVSIRTAAASFAPQGPFELIIDATGALTIDGQGPEKHLGALDATRMARNFQINTIGPALLVKHFGPLLSSKTRVAYAKLSARVGSISDNRKGGWYSYRASKAALNMLLQTSAIELQRKNPLLLMVALQPGTVQSALSTPFVLNQSDCLSAEHSVHGMLTAIDALKAQSGAHFIDYLGGNITW